MLLWITIGLFAIGAALWIFVKWSDYAHDNLYDIGVIFTVAFGLLLAIELVVMGVNYMGLKGSIKKDEQRFDALINQYEAVMDDKNYTLAHYNLIKDVEKWNETLAWHEENQHDFWIGPFIPDIYDKYEYITLNMFMKADYEGDWP